MAKKDEKREEIFANDDGYVFSTFSLGKINGFIAKLAEVFKFY